MGRRSRKRASGAAGEARTTTTARPERRPAAPEKAERKPARAGTPGRPGKDDRLTRGYARAEAKREQVRAELEPLAPGERPVWVTVAAVVAGVFAVANLVGGFLAVDEVPTLGSPLEALPWTVLLAVAAVGMWFGKYWAVLGFQAALAFQILVLSLALITASDLVLGIVIIVPILCGMGFLFYKLVRAMARLQMPPLR